MTVSLTIAGTVRDTDVVARRVPAELFCSRAALEAPVRGRSASPLGVRRSRRTNAQHPPPPRLGTTSLAACIGPGGLSVQMASRTAPRRASRIRHGFGLWGARHLWANLGSAAGLYAVRNRRLESSSAPHVLDKRVAKRRSLHDLQRSVGSLVTPDLGRFLSKAMTPNRGLERP